MEAITNRTNRRHAQPVCELTDQCMAQQWLTIHSLINQPAVTTSKRNGQDSLQRYQLITDPPIRLQLPHSDTDRLPSESETQTSIPQPKYTRGNDQINSQTVHKSAFDRKWMSYFLLFNSPSHNIESTSTFSYASNFHETNRWWRLVLNLLCYRWILY